MTASPVTEPFDAYSQWFDIPRNRRPPNHYELLGLEVLDSNSERIETAFQKRYALVRRYQVGEHGDEAVRVLKELAKAHDCLSNDETKQQYDDKLLKRFPELVPTAETIEAEPAPAVPVEQRKIWVIMPAEGRRWGPLVKSQIEQAVSQGRIRSDYYFQQDDWLEPRPVSEFFRNLPAPPPARLAPIQPASQFGAMQTPALAQASAQNVAPSGMGTVAKPHPTAQKPSTGQTPWKLIVPCIAIGIAVVILIPVSIAIFVTSGKSNQNDEEPVSVADNDARTSGDNRPVNSSAPVKSIRGGTGVFPRLSQVPSNASRSSKATLISVPGTAPSTWQLDNRFQGDCYRIAISPNGKLLAASMRSGGVQLMQVSDARVIHNLSSGGRELWMSSVFSNDGTLLAAGSSRGSIGVWRVADGKDASRIKLPEGGSIFDLAFTPDNQKLVCREGFKPVSIVDVASGQRLRAISPPPNSGTSFRSVALSPDGTHIAALASSTLFVMRLSDEEVLWRKRSRETAFASHVEYSPDGKVLAIRGRDNAIVIRATDGKFLRTINSEHPTGSLAGGLAQFSRDGSLLLVAAGQRADLWDWQSGRRVGSFESTTKAQVRSVALGPESDVVAVSVPTETMKVWRGEVGYESPTESTASSSASSDTGTAVNSKGTNPTPADPTTPIPRSYKLPTDENAINLLSLIDPARDKVKGDWRIENGKLICSTQSSVPKIEIPYVPPEEYDFRVVFSQPKLRHPVNLLMPNKGESFIWAVGGTRGTYYFSLEGRNTNPTQSWVGGLVKPDQLHTSVVQVRRDSVKGFVDGTLRVDYKTDFSDLKANSWHIIRDKRLLAVECDDPTTFHRIELIEITGTGTRTR